MDSDRLHVISPWYRKETTALAAMVWVTMLASNAAAQAWPQDNGALYLKLTGSYFKTGDEYNYRGDRQPIDAENFAYSSTSFRKIAISAYLEYGLTSNLTLVANLPFDILTKKTTETAIFGADPRTITGTSVNVSNLVLHLRRSLVRGPVALSLQGGVAVPLGYPQVPDRRVPAHGTGEVDGEIGLHWGMSLHPFAGYVGGGVSYVVRGGGIADAVAYSAQAGYTYGRVFAKLELAGVRSTTDPPDLAGTVVVQPGRVDRLQFGEQDVIKLIPVVTLSVNETYALTAEVYHVLAGKNALAGTTYAIGMVMSR